MLKQTIYYLFILVLISIYSLSSFATRADCNNYNVYVVNSGSMEPTFSQGELIVINCDSPLNTGDIITYLHPSTDTLPHSSTITHRVIDVRSEARDIKDSNTEDKIFYQTKGDANPAADGWIEDKYAVGKVVLNIPYIGRTILWLRTDIGKILGILLPVIIIVFIELFRIFHPKKPT